MDWETVLESKQQELDFITKLESGAEMALHVSVNNNKTAVRITRTKGGTVELSLSTAPMSGLTLEQAKEFALKTNEAFEALNRNAPKSK